MSARGGIAVDLVRYEELLDQVAGGKEAGADYLPQRSGPSSQDHRTSPHVDSPLSTSESVMAFFDTLSLMMNVSGEYAAMLDNDVSVARDVARRLEEVDRDTAAGFDVESRP
ncbi:MAG: hypothetical protein FWD83_04385 [Promicromonosporaceae bacterium]|nr:hypothetical protein [Promicromonosporaceae bacterium]